MAFADERIGMWDCAESGREGGRVVPVVRDHFYSPNPKVVLVSLSLRAFEYI